MQAPPPHPYLRRPHPPSSSSTHHRFLPPPSSSSSSSADASFLIDDHHHVDVHRYSCDSWLRFHDLVDDVSQPPAAPDPARISFSSDVNTLIVAADANDSSRPPASMDAASDQHAHPPKASVMHGNSHGSSAIVDGSLAPVLSTASSSYKGSSPPTSEFEFSMGDNSSTSELLLLSSSSGGGGGGTPYSPTGQIDCRPLRERQRHPCLAAADELFCDGKLLPLYSSAQNYSNYSALGGCGANATTCNGVLNQEAPIRRRSNAGETTYDYYIHGADHDGGTSTSGVPYSDHYINHRPPPADDSVVRPTAAADHPISPKAPTCTSRWKELLGLKKGGSSAQSSSDHDHLVCSTRSRSLHHHAASSNSKGMRSSDLMVNRILPAPPLVPGRRSLDSCNTTASNNNNCSSTSFRAGLQRLAPFQAMHRHSTHNNSNNVTSSAGTAAESAAVPASRSMELQPCEHRRHPAASAVSGGVFTDDCSDSDPAARLICPTTSCTSFSAGQQQHCRGYVGSSSSAITTYRASDLQVCDRCEPADHRMQARILMSNNNNNNPANEQWNGLDLAPAAGPATGKHNGGCSRSSNNWTTKVTDSGSCDRGGGDGNGQSATSTWVRHYTRGLVNMRSTSPPPPAAARSRAAGMANAGRVLAANHDRPSAGGNCGAAKQQQQTGVSYSKGGRVLHRSYSGPLKPSSARSKQAAMAMSCGKQQINQQLNSRGGTDPTTHQNGSRRAAAAAALERSSSYSAAGFRVTPVIHVPLYMITPGLMRTKLGTGGGGGTSRGGSTTSSSYGSILGGLAQTVFSSRN